MLFIAQNISSTKISLQFNNGRPRGSLLCHPDPTWERKIFGGYWNCCRLMILISQSWMEAASHSNVVSFKVTSFSGGQPIRNEQLKKKCKDVHLLDMTWDNLKGQPSELHGRSAEAFVKLHCNPTSLCSILFHYLPQIMSLVFPSTLLVCWQFLLTTTLREFASSGL